MLLVGSACSKDDNTNTKKETPNIVEVSKPLLKDVEIWDNYTARIEGEKSVEVRSRVSGYLQKICFNDGDFVNVGDILFEIDPRPFQAMVEASEAEVREIESRIEIVRAS